MPLFRVITIVLLASCLTRPVWSQTQPPQSAASATPPAKPAVKPAAAKIKPPKPAASPAAESGPCSTGVISALGDTFAVQKTGIIVLGDAFDEVPVSWGFDDLAYARVKAAGGAGVRRIATPSGAFDAYYHPKAPLWRDENEKLPAIVRKIAGSSGCARYLVVIRQDPERNRALSGLGVLSLHEGLVKHTQVFALLTVQLFDGRSFETISPPVSTKRVLAHLTDGMGPPSHAGDVDNSAFPASPADAASNMVLRDKARALLAYRLDQALPVYFNAEDQ